MRNLTQDALGHGNRKNKSFIAAMQKRELRMLTFLVGEAARIAVRGERSTLTGVMANEAVRRSGRVIQGGLNEKECAKIKEAREKDIIKRAKAIIKLRKQEADGQPDSTPSTSVTKKKKKGKKKLTR